MKNSKPVLRIAVMLMGIMLREGDKGALEGHAVNEFMDYVSYFKNFNTSFVWTRDGTYIGQRINNSYTGIFGLLHDGEADVFLLPLPVTPESEAIEIGPVLIASPTIIASQLKFKEYPDMILTQLFRFSAEIVALLLITMYYFARTLSRSEARFPLPGCVDNFVEGIWKCLEIMLMQSQLIPHSIAARILMMAMLIGVMFWYHMWGNEMKTEMIAIDTSETAISLEDLLHHNLTIMLSKYDPIQRLMESKANMDPSSIEARIYEKTVVIDMDKRMSDPNSIQLTAEYIKDKAFISSRVMFELMEGLTCTFVQDFLFYLVPTPIFLANFSPWINPKYPIEAKKMLYDRFVSIRETGMSMYIMKKIVERANDVEELKEMARIKKMESKSVAAGVPNDRCYYFSLEKFVNDILSETEFLSMNITQLKDVFQLLMFCLAASTLILLAERLGVIGAASKAYRTVARNLRNTKIHVRNGEAESHENCNPEEERKIQAYEYLDKMSTSTAALSATQRWRQTILFKSTLASVDEGCEKIESTQSVNEKQSSETAPSDQCSQPALVGNDRSTAIEIITKEANQVN